MTGSSRTFLLRAGRLIDPAEGIDGPATLLLADGQIVDNLPGSAGVDGLEVLDASGMVVCPGFVDLHTHLRFPGFPAKETMRTGTAAAAAGGFTTICAMANTVPVVDRIDVLQLVQEEARREARVHVHQLAAVTEGLLGEHLTDFATLSAAGAVAFSDDGKPVWRDEIMRRALIEAGDVGKVVSVHEEDPHLVRGGVANAGPSARHLGLQPWPCAGEASIAARDIALLEEVGGHVHLAHVSCAETVQLLRDAKDRGLNITAEATPHHLRLTDRLLQGDESLHLPPAHPCTKVNPPLRSQEDVDALVGALAEGIIDAIATDHAPHSAADKLVPYAEAAFGFSASETALPLLLDLVREGALDLCTLIARLTVGPARAFGLDVPTLAPGARADLCIFDPNTIWSPLPEALQSKGKNTPLRYARLTGRVIWTIVDGTVVYHHGTDNV